MSTFGNTSTSGISALSPLYDSGMGSFNVRGKFALTEAGDVSKVSAYIDNQGDGHQACDIRVGIYDDDGSEGLAATLMDSATLAVSDNQAAGWVDIEFSSAVSLTAGNWWLAIQGSASADGCMMYGQAGSGLLHVSIDAWADGMDSPPATPFFGDAYNLCIYATYTTGGGAAHLWIPSHHDGGLYERMAGGL